MADIIAKSALDNTIQGQMVNTQAQIVQLEGEASAAATQLSERQAGILQQDLDRVKVLQTQVNLIGQQVSKSDELITAYTNSLSERLVPNKNGRIIYYRRLCQKMKINFLFMRTQKQKFSIVQRQISKPFRV